MSDFHYPEGFLWGTSTSAHQVEGGNINSDSWLLEHLPGTMYAEPSGDACDHYHRYPQDIDMLAGLGFNAYRFSIEWARVEPEPGEFSLAALEHYRCMLAACHEHGLTPMVTLHHFTSPRWLIREGGWLDERTPDRFARYCERVAHHLGDLIGAACTINEANMPVLLSKMLPFDLSQQPWHTVAAQAFGAAGGQLGVFQFAEPGRSREVIMAAHRRGFDALHSGPGSFPVGLTLALPDIQTGADGEEYAATIRAAIADSYLEMLRGDNFVGVQTYTRMVYGQHGQIMPGEDVERNQMGEEFFPEALEGSVRNAAKVAGFPIFVTENGLASTDDTQRLDYIQRALSGLQRCLSSGIDVGGYFYWSAFDNFEWIFGYRPQFGLIAVDRQTQARTIKPSARWLGAFAQVH